LVLLVCQFGGFTGTDGLGFAAAENLYPSNLYADLSAATSATINAIRLAFQTQKLLERDARGGTRYTELVRAHFGVQSPDARLQRPEYLGGGKTAISINPIAQTSATNLDGGATPMGNLAAMATMLGQGHGFFAVVHGAWVYHRLGLCRCRFDVPAGSSASLVSVDSVRFFISRRSRCLASRLFEQGDLLPGDGNDALTFGYQERWAE